MSKYGKVYAPLSRTPAQLAHDRQPAPAEVDVTAPTNQIVSLQQVIGNRAVQRLNKVPTVNVVHRAPRQKIQRATGLAETSNISSFAQEALTFCQNSSNADKPLTDLADHLMSKINDGLKAIPSHECAHAFVSSGTVGAFASSTFAIQINTSSFSSRSGVTKVSELNQAEVAEIVDTIYHEARHSEQYYRLARTLAGEGKTATEIATQAKVPNTIAAEAVKNPLANNTTNATLIGEVNEWRDFIGAGRYVAYKGKVGNLRDAITGARQKVTAKNFAQFVTAYNIISGLMTTFFEPLIDDIGNKSPKTSADTLVETDVTSIKTQFDEVKRLRNLTTGLTWDQLNTAMIALHTARYQAYRNYPHEVDAWARGNEAGEKYKELDNASKAPTTTWIRSTAPSSQRGNFGMTPKTRTLPQPTPNTTDTTGTGTTTAPDTTTTNAPTTATTKATKKSWKDKLFEQFSKKRKK